MEKIDEIRELKAHYVTELYGGVRAQQKTDQTYRDDTFKVPEIKDPHRLLRSGLGSRMVDAPAEQIITSNPQVFVDVIKGESKAGERIAKEMNSVWIELLRTQNPNPFKEFVKNALARGESFIQVVHNENWVTKNKVRTGLPARFILLDPMVVYASPEEDENGIPEKVIVFYPRQPRDVLARYPHWGVKEDYKDIKTIEWFEYWDKDYRYFEADGRPVLKGDEGLQENIYKFVPFVRRYSGFGRRSPEGKLEDLIVSDIRFSRDLLREECAIRSDIASIFHLYAHKRMDLIIPVGKGDIDGTKIAAEYDMGAGSFNVLELPEGSVLKEGETMLPSVEAFQHLANIRAELEKRNPFIMSGFPFGSSGRQQDMSTSQAMKRYLTVVENTQTAFATAFEMALKICKRVPTLSPESFHKNDLDTAIKCSVNLQEVDPAEKSERITLGDRLWNMGNGSIDLKTNLVEYQGRTDDEANNIVANILVDKLTIYNPDVAEVMGMVFAEEAGMGEWLEKAKQRRMAMEQQQKGLQSMPAPTTTQRVQGETKTPLGQEMMDVALKNRGSRKPPVNYTRGG